MKDQAISTRTKKPLTNRNGWDVSNQKMSRIKE